MYLGPGYPQAPEEAQTSSSGILEVNIFIVLHLILCTGATGG